MIWDALQYIWSVIVQSKQFTQSIFLNGVYESTRSCLFLYYLRVRLAVMRIYGPSAAALWTRARMPSAAAGQAKGPGAAARSAYCSTCKTTLPRTSRRRMSRRTITKKFQYKRRPSIVYTPKCQCTLWVHREWIIRCLLFLIQKFRENSIFIQ